MCLPGTIETVREQSEREGVSRRALLAGGGAAAVAAALPGRGRRAQAPRRARGRPAPREDHRPHPPLPRRLPGLHGRRAAAPHAQELRPRRLLLAGVDVRRALGHPHGRSGPLRAGRPARAPAAPRGAARPGGRHRHLPARRLEPRRGGRAARPGALRAPPRPHPARRACAHGLRLGCAVSTTPRRSRTPTRAVPTTSPASASTRSSGCSSGATSAASGSTRSASTRATRPPSRSTTVCSGADRYGLENVANLPALRRKGAWVSVGVIPWEEGSGGPWRVSLTAESSGPGR